jgi:hypothetical protein
VSRGGGKNECLRKEGGLSGEAARSGGEAKRMKVNDEVDRDPRKRKSHGDQEGVDALDCRPQESTVDEGRIAMGDEVAVALGQEKLNKGRKEDKAILTRECPPT